MSKWQLAEQVSDDLLTQLLRNRGISEDDREVFLFPNYNRDVHDPMLFTRMQAAVDQIFLALEKNKSIVIHGDYDADGVSGSALLFDAINQIASKMNFTPKINAFLPDRERDGYGVAMHTIERLGEEGVNLLITVDCGIANAGELGRAHELGLGVIVCDHHQLAEQIPEHAILIHPLVPGEVYPNKKLCGTGVAFKLACALFQEARKRGANFAVGHEKWLLDLVAIATVTDVMPLIGENRALEKFGLIVLNKTRRVGLRKLIEASRTNMGEIDTQAIGFRIGPRLNAAGRVASAQTAFETLVAGAPQEALRLAQELDRLNRERQRISEIAYKQARKIVSNQKISRSIHVVWDESWPAGIVGLIAGKLVTEFGVPAFALTKVGEQYVGSGRSMGGLHLVEAMRSCGDIFVKAGGHPQACGLTIASLSNLEIFSSSVEEFAKKFFGNEGPQGVLEIDAELSLEELDENFIVSLECLRPYGEGNSSPKFLTSELTVLSARPVGSNETHLRLTLQSSKRGNIDMIGFNLAKRFSNLKMGDLVDVVYVPFINEWNGSSSRQGRVIDLRMSKRS